LNDDAEQTEKSSGHWVGRGGGGVAALDWAENRIVSTQVNHG
jgi:hypothetical protein